MEHSGSFVTRLNSLECIAAVGIVVFTLCLILPFLDRNSWLMHSIVRLRSAAKSTASLGGRSYLGARLTIYLAVREHICRLIGRLIVRICNDTDLLADIVGLGCDYLAQVPITLRIEVRVLWASTSIKPGQLRLLPIPHCHCRDDTASIRGYCVLKHGWLHCRFLNGASIADGKLLRLESPGSFGSAHDIVFLRLLFIARRHDLIVHAPFIEANFAAFKVRLKVLRWIDNITIARHICRPLSATLGESWWLASLEYGRPRLFC